MANYSFGRPIPDVENGHVFSGDNFTQLSPNTSILVGKTGLRFIGCNLTNCQIPEDSITDHCLHYHLSFCSHLHPDWVEIGLSQCVEVCPHVISSDTITIDGQAVQTTYFYEDKVI